VSGIMLTLLLIGMLTLAFNIQPAKASKPLAPNGVHNMTTYESRIGEQGLLFEDENLQMWVPASYENHSTIIFGYLVAGYVNLISIFGNHEYPYKFSIEHYPPGSLYFWGGTDARGTIRYGYSNLEDDTPEWNLYGVPHMIGYYEEMAHCFAYDFGVIDETSVGFYESLGMMIGGETALRAAYNPYIEERIRDDYQTFNETTIYYLEHDDGPPGVPENIWLTRVLAHIFKTEVTDVYGWDTLSEAFESMRDSYPLRKYDRDHTWGGFLHYLGEVAATDFHTVFGNYGLPMLTWTREIGYERDGVERIGNSTYRFRVKCLDRAGKQPENVKLHLYGEESVPGSPFKMFSAGGDNETGWIYEVEVDISTTVRYAISADDAAHSIFQAVGLPTFVNEGIQLKDFPETHRDNTEVYLILPACTGKDPTVGLPVWNASVSDWTAAGFVGGILQHEEVRYDTDPEIINQTTGEPTLTFSSGLVLFGGPRVDQPVYYYEVDKTAPVIYCGVPGAAGPEQPWSQWYHNDGKAITETAIGTTEHLDLFLIELFCDHQGRYILIVYGVGWKGSLAGGIYFDHVIYPDIGNYTNSWYIFKWEDDGDGNVEDLTEDTYTLLATGN